MKSLFQAVLVFFVAIPPLASFVSPAAAEVATFGKGAQVVVIDATDLTADQQRGLKEFSRKRDYFGALAASASTGRWDYETSFSDLATVSAFVTGRCNIMAKTSDCRIVALSLPKSLSTDTRAASGLSSRQLAYFEKTYLKSSRRYPRDYSAYAINEVFAVARWGRSYSKEAVSDALADCNRYAARLKATDHADVFKLRQTLGVLDCRIVDLRKFRLSRDPRPLIADY